MTQTTTYPLRLPRSLKRAVERQSKEDRTSTNQFVATAVAEKLSALQTAEFFAERKSRADFRNDGAEARRVLAMKCRLPRRKQLAAIVVIPDQDLF
jgi:hypothetical protein